ncbi:MAG: hypothetical protein KJ041_02355 [Gammaproteobacteria bacterium]|nr:hypothetical protein [Gammaproteobacteria bacterium]
MNNNGVTNAQDYVLFQPMPGLPPGPSAGREKRIGATERSPAERHRAMSWARRLKRVFRLDIEQCAG